MDSTTASEMYHVPFYIGKFQNSSWKNKLDQFFFYMDLYFPPVVQSAYKNKKNTLIRHNLQNIKKLITLIILPTTTQLSLTTVCDAVTSLKF